MKLLLLADTHVPKRARDLPDEVWHAVDSADLVFHAGDWVDAATLDRLQARARKLVGVFGNNDGPDLRSRLPEVARITLDGVRFAMIHETGPAAGREDRVDQNFAQTDVLVFGHSHIPWDSVTPGGMRLLNPGSPTDRRRQPAATFMTVEVAGSALQNVTLVALPPRRP